MHPTLTDDGLCVTAAEPWVRSKIQAIHSHLHAFMAHATVQANRLVFLDLYAGGGMFASGPQRELFFNSALSALSSGLPFSSFIFCEPNPEQSNALRVRANRYFRNSPVTIVDATPKVFAEKLNQYIPPDKKGDVRTAVFCLADPFSLDLPFTLVEALATPAVSFLIPYTFQLNPHHGFNDYLTEKKEGLKKFLGTTELRPLEEAENNGAFYKKLVRMHQNRMMMIGMNTSSALYPCTSSVMELNDYVVGFYSKGLSSKGIQEDAQRAMQSQNKVWGNSPIKTK